MRLLNTSTLQLHEFAAGNIPYYAILSHRWETEEVTFQALQEGKAFTIAGYSKLVNCCRQASRDGWEYCWIDTCCIDKSSSVELSEAINSMFRWYRDAQVCYAYLSDVPSDHNPYSGSVKFRASKWFTRGWTLQELLAPATVIFYDQAWNEIGTRSSLHRVLKEITGVKDFVYWEHCCIAQKMSWVAKRETTREEDMAYCLLGIFGVHMPPLYGEGGQAFMRLQLELLKVSNDESIFAWSLPSIDELLYGCRPGLLAENPSWFENCGDMVDKPCGELEGLTEPLTRRPYKMTNQGLCITFDLVRPAHLVVAGYSIYGRAESSSKLSELLYPSLCWSKWEPCWAPLNCWQQNETLFRVVLVLSRSETVENSYCVSPGDYRFPFMARHSPNLRYICISPTPTIYPDPGFLTMDTPTTKKLYVKQPTLGSLRPEFREEMPVIFRIYHKSILEHGFSLTGRWFQEGSDERLPPKDILVRDILSWASDQNYPSGLIFTDHKAPVFAALRYTSHKLTVIVLFYKNSAARKQGGVRVWILNELWTGDFGARMRRWAEKWYKSRSHCSYLGFWKERAACTDRHTMPLGEGLAVSAALTVGSQHQKLLYIIKLTVHEDNGQSEACTELERNLYSKLPSSIPMTLLEDLLELEGDSSGDDDSDVVLVRCKSEVNKPYALKTDS